jgi:hypothetical protein
VNHGVFEAECFGENNKDVPGRGQGQDHQPTAQHKQKAGGPFSLLAVKDYYLGQCLDPGRRKPALSQGFSGDVDDVQPGWNHAQGDCREQINEQGQPIGNVHNSSKSLDVSYFLTGLFEYCVHQSFRIHLIFQYLHRFMREQVQQLSIPLLRHPGLFPGSGSRVLLAGYALSKANHNPTF